MKNTDELNKYLALFEDADNSEEKEVFRAQILHLFEYPSNKLQPVSEEHVNSTEEDLKSKITWLETIIGKCRYSIGLPFSAEDVVLLTELKSRTITAFEAEGNKYYGDKDGF